VLGISSIYLGDNSERAYRRALELGERVGDSASVFRALIGLQGTKNFAGQLEQACEWSKRLLELAERLNDPVMLSEACYWRATDTYATGDVEGARRLVERAIAIRDRLPAHTRFYFRDQLGQCQAFLAQMLCLLGFPDQALRLCEQASPPPGSPQFTVSDSLLSLAMVYMLIRDWRQGLELSGKIIQSASGLGGQPLALAQAKLLRGWALTVEGRIEEGLSELNSGLSFRGVMGTYPGLHPFSLINLAQAQGQVGKPEEGLSIVDQLLADGSAQWLLGRVLRVRGELILAKDPAATEQAEECCRMAIAHARQCGAKWLELEGAIGLARLLKEQGRRDEARAMLADIYNWFTEGFDTADLKDAKALLDELNE
jgi:tetratricopeptide (TPR) repeat protein